MSKTRVVQGVSDGWVSSNEHSHVCTIQSFLKEAEEMRVKFDERKTEVCVHICISLVSIMLAYDVSYSLECLFS